MSDVPSIRERRLAVGERRLQALQRAGSASATPVLCVHGWLDNAASYLPLFCTARTDASLVAIDLPGHGGSSHTPGRYSIMDTVRCVIETLDALDWSDCHLVGHSLGACVAPIVAAAEPARIRSLFLIDALGPPTAPPSQVVERLRRSMRAGFDHRSNRMFDTADAAVEARRRATTMDELSARLIVERQLVRTATGFTWRFDPALRHPSPLYLTEGQVRAMLNAIECPVQLIRAGSGYLIGREGIDARSKAVADLELCDLEGHHHLHMDAPAETARVFDRWVERCRDAGG